MVCIGPTVIGHGSGSCLRHLRNRTLDSVISAASAKIPAEAATDVFRTRMRVLIEKRLEGHDEPGCAETTLRSVVIDECLLNRVGGIALHQALERVDCPARRLDSQDRARIDRPVVEEHSAGSALATIAHALGAGDIKLIAERVEQGDARLKLQRMFLAIDGEFDGNFARTINLYRLTSGLHHLGAKNGY